jgi:predicted glycosyltransferase
MKIIFYCQYVFGVGHLFRSVELVRALEGHDVILVVGGPEVEIDIPVHVKLVRLPALYMDDKFTTLIPQTRTKSVAQIKHERKSILFSLFETFKPDLFIVELYPFGRTIFGFELTPLLQAIRKGTFGKVHTACSLRDILVKKRDPIEYEQRVLNILNDLFDHLLIHSDADFFPLDATFSRAQEIAIPVFYTGFVTKKAANEPINTKKMLGLNRKQKLIVASAGGGRSGFRLLNSVVDACLLIKNLPKMHLEVFTGPFMDSDQYLKIKKKSGPGIHIKRFTRHFMDFLGSADLSVSMAGYNTCMDILTTKVPALVWPYKGDREQILRTQRLSDRGVFEVLNDDDLHPDRLASHINRALLGNTHPSISIDLNGTVKMAKWIERLEKI